MFPRSPILHPFQRNNVYRACNPPTSLIDRCQHRLIDLLLVSSNRSQSSSTKPSTIKKNLFSLRSALESNGISLTNHGKKKITTLLTRSDLRSSGHNQIAVLQQRLRDSLVEGDNDINAGRWRYEDLQYHRDTFMHRALLALSKADQEWVLEPMFSEPFLEFRKLPVVGLLNGLFVMGYVEDLREEEE